MIGKTLGLYIFMRFLKILIAMFIGLGFLIITVDFIEQLRKFSSLENVSILDLYLIAALRTPVFLEKAFPFACLFAAMITLTQLNSKMELVVARSAGVSAWQFLLPISMAAALAGILVATAYNPLAIFAFEESKNIQARILKIDLDATKNDVHGHWIKQEDEGGGKTIINARLARNGGLLLNEVKIIRFDGQGKILERLDAERAEHHGDHWRLFSVTRTANDGMMSQLTTMDLQTRLTKDELLGISTKPDGISFWKLPGTAKKVEKSGTNPKPYLVHYHSLMALPLFLIAMVLVAATVSLKFVRFGQGGRMILGGIVSGFVLYTLTSLITALGSNGVVPPAVAAWSPGFVAILFGMSILLHQEDG